MLALKRLQHRLAPIIPRRASQLIGAAAGFFIQHKTYSQHGEDLIVDRLFRGARIQNGYYVDIGCFHPSWWSNTKLLHDKGWSGLAADIDSFKVRLYRMARGRRTRVVRAAVTGGTSGTVSLYRFQKFFSEIDTVDEATAIAYRKQLGIAFDIEPVRSINISELLDKCKRPVNFLNIDVEGLDVDIVRHIDFTKHRPEVICFEEHESILPSPGIVSFLSERGYSHLFSAYSSHGFALASVCARKPFY